MKILPGLLLLALPFVCAADVVVTVDSVASYVNIRQSPDANAEIVGRLQKGVPKTLVQSIPGWHEVELDDEGTTGFVTSDWSRVIADGTIEVAAEPVVEAEESVEEAAEESVEAVVEPVVEEAAEEAAEEVAEEVTEEVAEEVIEEVTEEAAEEVIEEVTEELIEVVDDPVPEVVAEDLVAPEPAPEPPDRSRVTMTKGTPGFLAKFKEPTVATDSQVYDDGNQIGIGTTAPKQRLEVNGSIQIHERNSSVAGLMITQSSGETGYIMHNRASTLTIGAGSVDRITIDRDGNVGVGVARPAHPLEMASGAHATSGGVWTNSSSRDRKENISELSVEDALAALAKLQPVQFNYKNDAQESYVGFIAEDVPELVATSDRKGLSAMDVVAVLTRVIQEQQQRIEELEARIVQ
jgi:SH3-like domain-containing protein